MNSQAAMLVAFLSGQAVPNGPGEPQKWWHDPGVQGRLHLTPQQVQALEDIFTQADGQARTLMLWRMYQTLSPPQRQQFAQLLRIVRT